MQTAISLEKSGAIINLRKCSGRIISTEISILKSVLIATITNHAGGHHVGAIVPADRWSRSPFKYERRSRLILNASSDTGTQSRSSSNCKIKRRISDRSAYACQ